MQLLKVKIKGLILYNTHETGVSALCNISLTYKEKSKCDGKFKLSAKGTGR